ncbi:hypothetical protein WDW86_18570 [Bdellovibrionota bacterium FG-2]
MRNLFSILVCALTLTTTSVAFAASWAGNYEGDVLNLKNSSVQYTGAVLFIDEVAQAESSITYGIEAGLLTSDMRGGLFFSFNTIAGNGAPSSNYIWADSSKEPCYGEADVWCLLDAIHLVRNENGDVKGELSHDLVKSMSESVSLTATLKLKKL